MNKRIAAAAATLSCVLTTLLVAEGAARAATVSGFDSTAAPSIRVPTVDLDLTSNAGAQRLTRRIEAAAETVCQTNATKSLAMRFRHVQCYRAAVADGLRQRDRIIAMRMERSTKGTAQLAIVVRPDASM